MIKRVKLINIQAILSFFFFYTNVNVQYITATILIKTCWIYIFEVACSKKFEFFIRDEKNLLITNM